MDMVKMSALRPFMGQQGMVQEKQTIEVSAPRARELIRLKLATELVGGAMKTRGGEGKADPTTSRPDGSQTGAEKPALLSAPDLPRQKRKYTRRAVAPEPSSSIDHGN